MSDPEKTRSSSKKRSYVGDKGFFYELRQSFMRGLGAGVAGLFSIGALVVGASAALWLSTELTFVASFILICIAVAAMIGAFWIMSIFNG